MAMKKFWVTCMAVTVALAVTGRVEAFGHRGGCCEASAGCETQVTYVDKVVTCYRPKMVEVEIECRVMKVVCKEIPIETKCTVMVPEWKEEKRQVTVCKLVSKEVEKEVTCTRYVAESVKDPCTGCLRTVCKPVTEVKKVKTTICERQEEVQEVMVKVCSYKPEVRVYKCTRVVAECTPEIVKRKVLQCVLEPYQTTIKVAVCK
jgi:hypothetical protein